MSRIRNLVFQLSLMAILVILRILNQSKTCDKITTTMLSNLASQVELILLFILNNDLVLI
jgi:hypothetical protein